MSRVNIAGGVQRRRSARWLLPLLGVALALGLTIPGCRDKQSTSSQTARSQAAQGQLSVKLLESAIEMLDQLSGVDPAQAMRQIADRLNQWGSSQDRTDWQPDPVVSEARSKWPNAPGLERLDKLRFELDDAFALQEAHWLKEISDRAGKDTDLAMASSLFDWTIRNIQLVGDDEPEARLGYLPSEILLLGRGTAVERAWVFMLLARQVGLDTAMLAIGDGSSDELNPWLPAVWIENRWYLFDTRLGLPIPGTNGESVATLEEVRADEGLLRRLDLEGETYPVDADDLTKVVAWLETSPHSLSRRMQLVESKLPGNQKLVISVRPSHLVEEIKKAQSPVIVELWPLPYERRERRAKLSEAEQRALVLERAHIDLLMVPARIGSSKSRRPENEDEEQGQQQVEMVFPLRTGRPLHLVGKFDGEQGAKHYLMLARPSARQLGTLKVQLERALMERAKQDATYWLGLIAVEQGKQDSVAVDFFQNKTLDAFPGGRWEAGARYNLARAFEAAGDAQKAIELYEADDSPQRHGNLLRARRLKANVDRAISDDVQTDRPADN